MPPRFAYWTILIDNAPTAFRARDAQELLPTLNQLKRTNENVVMKWFSGGTLWDSPEAARHARRPKVFEKRGAEWRPGGQHRDPRARFDKKRPPPKRDQRDRGPQGVGPSGQKSTRPSQGRNPWSGTPTRGSKPGGGQRFAKPWQNRDHDRRPGPPRRHPHGPGKRRDEE